MMMFDPPGETIVRRGTEADLPQVLSFARAVVDAPLWTSVAWRQFVIGNAGASASRLLLLTQTIGGELRGLLAASLLFEQTELEAIVVHPGERRRGIGCALVQGWMAWAEAERASVAQLEVRASNTAALGLYASFGFRVEGRRSRYYREPVEDALLMTRQIGTL